ncbi:MAG: amino acid ABC transporter permease [Nitrosospira sp.]|nr:amino acid ABC transporter permease [Nitrosospira sp.]
MSATLEHKPAPDQAPPVITVGAVAWLRQNLFSSWTNTALTIIAVYLMVEFLPPMIEWALLNANWTGDSRAICDANPDGACWTFVRVRLLQILFGLWYGSHPSQIWRPILAFALLIVLAIPLFIESFRYKRYVALFLLVVFPFIAYALIHGAWLGLPVAGTAQWGGFMLTVILAIVGIVFALPIGILLALGRRSTMPIVKTVSVFYIEFWRGTPLITVLFMASVMLPLFFPAQVDLDKVLRAMVGITMFQSAYTAEAIRAGLQAMPKGQFEAADAMGLKFWQSMRLIILPQALKISIPGIVNTFIELFKDTSLVAIIGLLDLLNMARITSRSTEWKGFDVEAYLFAALLYWICCYGMSRYSQALEAKLETGHKR